MPHSPPTGGSGSVASRRKGRATAADPLAVCSVALVDHVMDTEGSSCRRMWRHFSRGPIRDIQIGRFRGVDRQQEHPLGRSRCRRRQGRLDPLHEEGGERQAEQYLPDFHQQASSRAGAIRDADARALAHLFLGHLGADNALGEHCSDLAHRQEELEAESVAFIVCERAKWCSVEIENLPGKFCELEHDRRKPRHLRRPKTTPPGRSRRCWALAQRPISRLPVVAHDRAGQPAPGFVVRTEAQKAAWDNGYRIERGIEGCQQCKLGLVHRFRSSIICRVIPGRGLKGRGPGNPVITGGAYWIPGSPLRGQVYAGCVNLPASAPRNDNFRHQSSWPRRARP